MLPAGERGPSRQTEPGGRQGGGCCGCGGAAVPTNARGGREPRAGESHPGTSPQSLGLPMCRLAGTLNLLQAQRMVASAAVVWCTTVCVVASRWGLVPGTSLPADGGMVAATHQRQQLMHAHVARCRLPHPRMEKSSVPVACVVMTPG